MKPLPLSPSARLQLWGLLGIVIAMVPGMLLLSLVPPFRDWPLWGLIALPSALGVLCMVWFRQCIAPDGSSVKPKWW